MYIFFSGNGHPRKVQKDWDQSRISIEENVRKIGVNIKDKIHIPVEHKRLNERKSQERHKDYESRYRYQRKDREDERDDIEEREDREERDNRKIHRENKAGNERLDVGRDINIKDYRHDEVRYGPKGQDIDMG